jgi:hypothetical protein
MGGLAGDIDNAFGGYSRRPQILSCIAGLGGRAMKVEKAEEILDRLTRPDKWKYNTRPTWVDVNGGE